MRKLVISAVPIIGLPREIKYKIGKCFGFTARFRTPFAVLPLAQDFAPEEFSGLVKARVIGRFQAMHGSLLRLTRPLCSVEYLG